MKNALRYAALGLLGLAAQAQAQVTEFTLDNGLKVIVKEDHRAPVVVSQVWYKIGSSYEHEGITGLSHVLEHMMFKGTKDVPAGEFSRIIAANGGEENAFTGRDYTTYFETLSADRLPVAFKLEADRMHNLVLDPAEVKKETEVVKEERRLRTEDKPTGLLYEQFNAAAWRASPYHNPVIGWMNDLDNLRVSDLRAWYKRWYSPGNATLVVAGDVKPDEVKALAEKYFGPIPAVKLDPPRPFVEPPQFGETRVTVSVPAKQPYLMMGYKTPVVGTADEDWEPYALTVLAAILDGGSSARLSTDVVRKQGIAASAGAGYDAYSRLPSQLVLDGTPTAGNSLDKIEAALRAEVKRLRDEPVSQDELNRVIAQAVAQKVYQKDSLFYQAMQLGLLETIGQDWRLADQELAKLKAVTPEQVQAVARKYLVDRNLTVAVLKPEATKQGGKDDA